MASSPEGMEETRAMREFGARREHPELKELVVEASRALARLDADRLEELALSCQRGRWRCLPECWRRRGPT